MYWKYLPPRPPWPTAEQFALVDVSARASQGIIACDFLVVVTATFRLLYVFVVTARRSRHLVHCSVTAHPTSALTMQQLREAVALESRDEYLLHDRTAFFRMPQRVDSKAPCAEQARYLQVALVIATSSVLCVTPGISPLRRPAHRFATTLRTPRSPLQQHPATAFAPMPASAAFARARLAAS